MSEAGSPGDFGSMGIDNSEMPLPSFPLQVTCLFALPSVAHIADGITFEVPASSAHYGDTAEAQQRVYMLTFHTLRDTDVRVPAARNIQVFRAVAERIGVHDVTFDDPEAWEYDDSPHWQTVVTVETEVRSADEWFGTASAEGGTYPAPLACMYALIDLHRVYRVHESHAIAELTLSTLWNAFPVLITEPDGSRRFYSWYASPHGDPGVEPQDIEGHDVEHYERILSAFTRQEAGDPLLAYYERLVQAQTDLVTFGRPHEAVYQVATASEALITNIALMTAWERSLQGKVDTESSARMHNWGLTKKAENLSQLLGDDWSDIRSGLWGDWFAKTWEVRNRVVHADYRASAAEASFAIASTVQLKRDIDEAVRQKFEHFPRTCLTLYSGRDLDELAPEARRPLDAYWQRAYDSLRDIPQKVWMHQFLQWRTSVFEEATRQRAERKGKQERQV